MNSKILRYIVDFTMKDEKDEKWSNDKKFGVIKINDNNRNIKRMKIV